MLVLLLTSARVAPGLLSWQAWDALRGAARVLVGSADHPQVPLLAEAGVVADVVAGLGDAAALGRPAEAGDTAVLARVLADAALAAGAGGLGAGGLGAGGQGGEMVVWLAPAGAHASADLLGALGELVGDVQVLTGSRDLPGAHVIDVVATMSTLRTSCPWDRRQTHASLAPHLIEESYEALDALEQGDHQALREELGDVLLQVAFHAAIAAERGTGEGGYTIDDIADTLVAKLVRRHPHVFGDVSVGSADEVTRNWDEIKKAERAAKLAAAGADTVGGAGGDRRATPSVLDGIVLGQPALSLAAQVLRRAGRAGYPGELLGASAHDGPDGDGPDGNGTDLGSQLMRLVTGAQRAGLDPEAALRAIVRTSMARIHDWEQAATLRAGAAQRILRFCPVLFARSKLCHAFPILPVLPGVLTARAGGTGGPGHGC